MSNIFSLQKNRLRRKCDVNSFFRAQPITSKITLESEFQREFFPFAVVFPALYLILYAIEDRQSLGWRLDWLLFRLLYLPFVLTCRAVFNHPSIKSKFHHETPLWLAIAYFILFITHIVYRTGGFHSQYVMSYLQVFLILSVMAVQATTFFITVFATFLILFATGFFLNATQINNDGPDNVRLLLYFTSLASFIYILSSSIRRQKITLHNKLAETLANQAITIETQTQQLTKARTAEALADLATQVAHDIRSPLAALDIALTNFPSLDTEKRALIQGATARVRSIANNLLQKNRSLKNANDGPTLETPLTLTPCMLPLLVDTLISEKRVQYSAKLGVELDWRIRPEHYGLFSKVNPVDFRSVLSNIIDNSVEALSDPGLIKIALTGNGPSATLTIIDNGKGIPADLLPKLMTKGATFGKKEGSGLGLFHAKTTIEKWGGRVELESSLRSGTTVRIFLPRCDAPRWFIPEFVLFPGADVVILSRDPSVYKVWIERLNSNPLFSENSHVLDFYTVAEFSNWITLKPESQMSARCLIEYQLDDARSDGVRLIKGSNLESSAFLVSDFCDETTVAESCSEIGLGIIPKAMVDFVPVRFVG